MKTKIIRGWKWIFAICSTVVFLGCLGESSKTNAENAPVIGVTNSPPPSADVVADTPPARAVIPPADLSPGVSEIVKLAQSGVGEEVLVAYVEKSGRTFNPSVDEIVYLKDLGIPEAVLAALVRKGNLTNDVAQAAPEFQQENSQSPEAPQTNANAPSLIDPVAPSYSVISEPAATETVVNPPQQVNITYFENTLAPYGTWVDVPDYGRCWQPTVVIINRDWRPYSDRGRWAYTSAGWYWQSDYSWGWAPFHYGRWHQDHRVGWVWVPGSTWGPAWVSWRYTDSYYGWAPLPPTAHYVSGVGFRYRGSHVGINFDFGLRDDCYTFIPSSRFCDPTPYRYYAPRSHSRTIYQNSVVINNYIRGNNNTIINEGIGRDRVATATRQPIRTVAIRDLPTTSTPAGRAERIERGGNTLAVFRPNVAMQNSLARSGNTQTAPAGSTAVSSAVERRSFTGPRTTPSRGETSAQVPATSSAKTPSPSTPETPIAATRPTFTRTWTQPGSNARQIPSRGETRSTVAPTVPSSTETPATAAAAPTRPQPSFGSRQLPTRSPARAVEQTQVAEVPRQSPANAVRNVPSTSPSPFQRSTVRTTPPTVSRAEPSVSQPSRVPAPVQRPQSSSPYGAAAFERSVPARPAPSMQAPAPVQRTTFSAPPQVSRSVERVERSIPQRSQPAPSVAPQRSAPEPRSQPAARDQGSRGNLGRSSRDRN